MEYIQSSLDFLQSFRQISVSRTCIPAIFYLRYHLLWSIVVCVSTSLSVTQCNGNTNIKYYFANIDSMECCFNIGSYVKYCTCSMIFVNYEEPTSKGIEITWRVPIADKCIVYLKMSFYDNFAMVSEWVYIATLSSVGREIKCNINRALLSYVAL